MTAPAKSIADVVRRAQDEAAKCRYVRIRRAAELTGYSAKAINRKRETGRWPEGLLWHRAPDGSILIDLEGYAKWVEGAVGSRSERAAFG
jgi:hypothetical protein